MLYREKLSIDIDVFLLLWWVKKLVEFMVYYEEKQKFLKETLPERFRMISDIVSQEK
jgi:hypothetical protein